MTFEEIEAIVWTEMLRALGEEMTSSNKREARERGVGFAPWAILYTLTETFAETFVPCGRE